MSLPKFNPKLNSNFNRKLDVVFALDTTGSMGSWIERAKSTISTMSEKMAMNELDVMFNIVGYKDVTDRKCEEHQMCPVSCQKSRWVQISGFTEDPVKIKSFLENVYASGGGDVPEDLFGALHLATMEKWREGSNRVIVVISDAPPHGKEFSGNDYHSNTPNYPLPYEESKLPEEIAGDLLRNKINVFVLHVKNNVLNKTVSFLEENEVKTWVSSLVKNPWKFSLVVPDDITCMAMDVGKEDDILSVNSVTPLSSAFFQMRPGINSEKLHSLIENSFNFGMKDTLRLILYIRDRKGDVKEKTLGRDAFWTLRKLDPSFTSQYYKEFVKDSGCLNDLLYFSSKADEEYGKRNHLELLFLAVTTIDCYLKNINTEKGKEILENLPKNKRDRHERLQKCLNKRTLEKINDRRNIEIEPYFIYKWLPRFGSTRRKNGKKRTKKWERENNFATRLSKLMFVNQKDVSLENDIDNCFLDIPAREIIKFIDIHVRDNPEREAFYREVYSFISKLCENLPVEVPMCAREWEENVEPSKATSGAQKKYKKCFSKRVPGKLKKTIDNGKVKVTTLKGEEMVSHFINKVMSKKVGEECQLILEDEFVNAQWEKYFEKNKINGNFTFQIDCTGSMLSGDKMPLTSALSLFLQSGKSRFITFDEPRWQEVPSDSLKEKVTSILDTISSSYGDIPGGVNLALSQENQPDVHFVLTDGRYPRMNIKEAGEIRDKLCKGKLTKIVIINLRVGDDELLLRKPDNIQDFYVVSGNSPAIIKLFVNSNGDIESYIRTMLREKYPLE